MSLFFLLPTASGPIVTLTGGTFTTDTTTGSNSLMRIKFADTGGVYTQENSDPYGAWQAPTNWVVPNQYAPGAYQIRWTNATGDFADMTTTATEDTWYTLVSGDFILTLTDTIDSAPGLSATFDVEIREGTGATLASASFTLEANLSTA